MPFLSFSFKYLSRATLSFPIDHPGQKTTDRSSQILYSDIPMTKGTIHLIVMRQIIVVFVAQ